MAQGIQVDAPWTEVLVVVALDIGTSYSGYVISFLDTYRRRSIDEVQARLWRSGSITTFKAPTCVLCNANKEFHSFGYEAEGHFSALPDDDEDPSDWYFFKNFKMLLYKEQDLSRGTELLDATGKKMLAIDVFVMCIKYLKDTAVEEAIARVEELKESDFHWVVTVPAIWSDQSKQFMREAAEKAGIENSHLRLALEPECASVFCRDVAVRKSLSHIGTVTDLSTMESGSRYMVVDMGGGTIDVTVHEVTENGALKEITQASGGEWGANQVNTAFSAFMIKIFGAPVWKKFETGFPIEFYEFMQDFERKKCSKPNKKVNISIPITLSELHKENEGCDLSMSLKSMNLSGTSVQFKQGNRLSLDAELFQKEFFASCIENITVHLETVIQRVPNLKRILLVGGFSECLLVNDSIKKTFPKQRVILPPEATVAVLRGAILYGRDPSVIKSRICKFTYGFDWSEEYNPMIHPRDKRINTDDGPYCSDIFKKLVEVGEEINVGHCSEEIETFVTYQFQERIAFPFYKSTQKSPRFVTDEGCTHIGTLYMDVPYSREGVNRSVFIQVQFGGTEITAKARDRTGQKVKSTRFDLL
ncbi:hypothetical protein CHS0354_034177 [Potamilus streckersoni]|uniref:Heat shock 70 kDa protein 12A n=1 Tax=Potamilus streckersoni TaxID=2493646 RepID=A0AAE0RN37_9BIVA|nr:hypothetical protein CHS0354_034177 [Potamilus streckersoni]KAK3576502.1 hypothetical protein CHS0354_034177 [Potamilus streckersoni]